MGELLHARHITTGEAVVLEDSIPLASAQLFKAISDEIWKTVGANPVTSASINSVLIPKEARDYLNEALAPIDERLVLSGGTQPLRIIGQRPEDVVELSPDTLQTPAQVMVGTFNWDSRAAVRLVQDGDKTLGVGFTTHRDYHREIYAGLVFKEKTRIGILNYALQRTQVAQDRCVHLTTKYWLSDFAETGYEGSAVLHSELTEVHEAAILKAIQLIGGLSLKS